MGGGGGVTKPAPLLRINHSGTFKNTIIKNSPQRGVAIGGAGIVVDNVTVDNGASLQLTGLGKLLFNQFFPKPTGMLVLSATTLMGSTCLQMVQSLSKIPIITARMIAWLSTAEMQSLSRYAPRSGPLLRYISVVDVSC